MSDEFSNTIVDVENQNFENAEDDEGFVVGDEEQRKYERYY